MPAVRILDVGCGDGDFLIRSARARPGIRHLGIDLLAPVIERASRRARELGLSNVRFLAGDAVRWLRETPAEGSLDEIHVYHPQPYYDPDEVPLGMLTPKFFESAWRALRPEGILVLQTDRKPYGKYLLVAAGKYFEPQEVEAPGPDAPEGRTRREVRSRRKGMVIRRIVARRRERPLDLEDPPAYFDPERPGIRRRRRKKTRRSKSV